MQTIDQLLSGELAGSRHLKLACNLNRFPQEIFNLKDTLEILDLSGNSLSELPDDLAQLTKLQIIFCSNNQFTELPAVLGECSNLTMIGFKANRIRKVPANALPVKLRWLILTDNEIEELPNEIGHCSQLQKLMLAGNKLQELPISLSHCKRLELLRIAANQFNKIPAWLFALPRLSWLGFSGNPFGLTLEREMLNKAIMGDIPWQALKLNNLLGEGASGFIYRAQLQLSENKFSDVAVKLFKGTVTSDGLPDSEMTAAIGAGSHANLINVLGRVIGHPTDVSGLVMELIAAEFRNLAGPPSFVTCTRDVYPEDVYYDLPVLLQIAYGIASAAEHLHKQGILHGDLYAHNILYSDQGKPLIGDFGAASLYSRDDAVFAGAIERLEVRAFGCLLEELTERCKPKPDASNVLELLNDLKSACLSNENENRPLFSEITSLLKNIILELN